MQALARTGRGRGCRDRRPGSHHRAVPRLATCTRGTFRRVLGHDLTESEVRAWTRRAFLAYARYWMEGARLPAVPAPKNPRPDDLPRGHGASRTRDGEGRGVVMALPHVGSWEWGGAWLALKGYPMTAVAEPRRTARALRLLREPARADGPRDREARPGNGKRSAQDASCRAAGRSALRPRHRRQRCRASSSSVRRRPFLPVPQRSH